MDTYINLCQTLGPLTDWVQGPGGNFSIKTSADTLIVKKSGAIIAKTTENNGWVECSISKIREQYENNNEDISETVIRGQGKPSIEAFFHIIETPIVVHLHPSKLLNILCNDIHLENFPQIKTIPYSKPGIPIAKEFFKSYQKEIPIYFLKNHGIIIIGNTPEDIYKHLIFLRKQFIKTEHSTNIELVLEIRKKIYEKTGKNMIIKPLFSNISPSHRYYRLFFPYTPDIVVFLQKYPLSFESDNDPPANIFEEYYEKHNIIPSIILTPSMVYTIGVNFEACISIEEIFQAYTEIEDGASFLDNAEVEELITWDKEKERKFGSLPPSK